MSVSCFSFWLYCSIYITASFLICLHVSFSFSCHLIFFLSFSLQPILLLCSIHFFDLLLSPISSMKSFYCLWLHCTQQLSTFVSLQPSSHLFSQSLLNVSKEEKVQFPTEWHSMSPNNYIGRSIYSIQIENTPK